MSGVAAILGAGAIGAGWAARFALMGWEVRVFDPDAAAADRLQAVLDNARRALPGLADRPLPPEGPVHVVPTISQAVRGAEWIQESVPERLDLKRTLYQKVQEHCAEGVTIASSTAGFTPTALQGQGAHSCPILVAHPCDPVYLLPLVELVAAPDASADLIPRARTVLERIGMAPLHIRAEIEGHIADRLFQSVMREALRLVHDGVATTAEIDEAIRLGFGPGWAQMGLFEACRIAGGEKGMAHGLTRLGPGLELPRSHLGEAPELTDELVRTIAEQSDAQSGAHGIDELERQRDTNLVAILRALKWAGWGAGRHLRAMDARLAPGAPDIARPIVTVDRAVPLDWTDYNGHMTEPRYLQAFSDATDRFMELVGCDADYIASGGSFFTAESHIRHIAEAHAGQRIRVETLCLAGAGKKMHLFHRMFAGDGLLATDEALLIHVSLETRRAAPPGPEVARRLAEIAEAHAGLPRPEGIGRAVGERPA